MSDVRPIEAPRPRAVIYARYSTDKQDRRSIDDQVRLCRRYAEQKGFDVVDVVSDAATSGTRGDRPGFQRIRALARARHMDVVIVEDIDRLSRRQALLHALRELLTGYRVEIHDAAIGGPVTAMSAGLKGLMSEEMIAVLANKTRRGLEGKAATGGSTGGRAYGYRTEVVAAKPNGKQDDRLVIVEAEAITVRRIFDLYLEDLSLQQIADTLNREGVPPPSGRPGGRWRATTISGTPGKGEGILNNALYIGRRVFNRRRWLRVPSPDDPDVMLRQPVMNDPSQWTVTEVPDLRIVSDEVWQAVKARQAAQRALRVTASNGLNVHHRPSYLLSNLVYCGVCGGKVISQGGGKWQCATRKESPSLCTNHRRIDRDELEGRLLAAIRTRLLAPELLEHFAAKLKAELSQMRSERSERRLQVEKKMPETARRIANLVELAADGRAPKAILAQITMLEAEQLALQQELAGLQEPTVVQLPTNYAAHYRRAVDKLSEVLGDPEEARAGRAAIRALIEKIVMTPAERGAPVRLELFGDLAGILAFAAAATEASVNRSGPNAKNPTFRGERGVSLVAGAGFEPATFRL